MGGGGRKNISCGQKELFMGSSVVKREINLVFVASCKSREASDQKRVINVARIFTRIEEISFANSDILYSELNVSLQMFMPEYR